MKTSIHLLLTAFTAMLGVPRRNIARLHADATLDTGFDPKANRWVYSVAEQADGKVLLGGWFSTLQPNGAATPTTRWRIARRMSSVFPSRFSATPGGASRSNEVKA